MTFLHRLGGRKRGDGWRELGVHPGGVSPPGAQESGPLLPVHLNGFVPTVGESFTFMNYSAPTGIFFIFDRNIDNAMEHWDVTYQSNSAILTVAFGNVSVPDRGSTLLLLTLSLLGLLLCQCQLLRKQS